MNHVGFKKLKNILFLVVTSLLLSSNAWGATVTAISKKKALIKIDEGTAAGFNKGVKVCFFDEADKRMACGKVTKSKAKFAFVKVPKKILKKIAKGQIAKVAAGADAKVAKGSAEAEPTEAADASGLAPHRTNFQIGGVPGLAPSTYNKLTYKAPFFDGDGNSESFNTLWQSEGKTDLSIFAIQVAGEFAIGQSMAISAGLRYLSFRDFVAQADYKTTDSDKLDQYLEEYIETTQTGTAIGVFTDFTYLDISLANWAFWRSSVGLDIDMSTVNFKATHKSQDGPDEDTEAVEPLGEIASATSKLTVVSLRLGTNFNISLFGPVGFIIGPNIIVPLTTFGKSFSAKINDPNAAESFDASGDLEKALGHTKSTFGVELLLAAYVAF